MGCRAADRHCCGHPLLAAAWRPYSRERRPLCGARRPDDDQPGSAAAVRFSGDLRLRLPPTGHLDRSVHVGHGPRELVALADRRPLFRCARFAFIPGAIGGSADSGRVVSNPAVFRTQLPRWHKKHEYAGGGEPSFVPGAGLARGRAGRLRIRARCGSLCRIRNRRPRAWECSTQ